MKYQQLLALLLGVFGSTILFGQVKIDAEFRPRFEYRHGYKKLAVKTDKAAMFTSQRTRLNADYKKEKIRFYLSLQDVRVWGDVPQLSAGDLNGLAIHQAWGELIFNPTFSVKLGRQALSYDDQRILGGVGWAQQARSHDAAVFKYDKDGFKADLGLAFNQSKQGLTGTYLATPRTYKSLQYLWLNKTWEKFEGSFLFLNNGVQYQKDTFSFATAFSQTAGVHLKTKGTLNLAANAYYQFGKDGLNRDLSAYLVGLTAGYKMSDRSNYAVGFELQSGNDLGIIKDKNNAFTPFYGTNHKFNGFMDYFYTGNHINSVGLLNVFAKASFKVDKKSNLTLFLHNFTSAKDILPNETKQLGQEVDLVYAYKFSEIASIKAGYSHLFPTASMQLLKSGSSETINNWGWIMVTIKPTLFHQKLK